MIVEAIRGKNRSPLPSLGSPTIRGVTIGDFFKTTGKVLFTFVGAHEMNRHAAEAAELATPDGNEASDEAANRAFEIRQGIQDIWRKDSN